MSSSTTTREASAENVLGEIRTAVRHSLIYGIGNVATKAIGFLMVPFYTHYLTPADYGTLEVLDLSMSLFGMFLAMGMVSALLRCYARADSEEQRLKTVSTAFLFVLATGAVAYTLLFGFIDPLSALIVGPRTPSTYLLLAFTAFILGYVLNVPKTYLRAREASGSFVAVDTISLCLMLVLNIVFLVVFKTGLIGILLSSVIVAVLQVIVLSVWLIRKVTMRFSRVLLKKMLVFGFPLVFANMATFTLNFSDRFFLQHLRSLEMVGMYAVGYKFAFMLNYLLVQPFYVMWQSRMYIIHKQPNHREIFAQMFAMYSLLLIYAGLALALLSPEIMSIMVNRRFAEGQQVIPVVVLAYIFYGIGFYVQLGMFLTDKTAHVGYVGAASAAINLVLNYLLISRFGMIGAAWATALSFAALAIASYLCSNRVLPLPLGILRVTLGLCTAVALYGLCQTVVPPFRWSALALKTCILLLFPVLIWKAGILSAAESATVWSAVGGVVRAGRVQLKRALG